MSDREKKLVLLFGLAAFVLLNVFGISWFKGYQTKLAKKLSEAESNVQVAEAYDASYANVETEMKWLEDRLPAPKAGQLVQTQLEKFASDEASKAQLTIKRRKILPSDETPGAEFHRAKVEFNVTGRELGLYAWLDKLQVPNEFRAITHLKLSPDSKDDTMIECTVTAEQWYLPQGEATDEAAPEGGANESENATPLPGGQPVEQ